jgi:hypothetical protein
MKLIFLHFKKKSPLSPKEKGKKKKEKEMAYP